MQRYILEKATNYNDIRRGIFGKQPFKIDGAVLEKGFKAKQDQMLSVEALMEKIEAHQQLFKAFQLPSFAQMQLTSKNGLLEVQNCLLYAMTMFIVQNKSAFRDVVLQQTVNAINALSQVDGFDLNKPVFLLAIYGQDLPLFKNVQRPCLDEYEFKLLSENFERIMVHGLVLYQLLMIDNLRQLSLVEFALMVEVKGANFGFIDELQAFNFENRKLSVFLSTFTNLFHKRNNGKGDSNVQDTQFLLQNFDLKDDITSLKEKAKTFYSGEFNQTLKATFTKTKILSGMFRMLSSSFDKLRVLIESQTSFITESLMSVVKDFQESLIQQGKEEDLQALQNEKNSLNSWMELAQNTGDHVSLVQLMLATESFKRVTYLQNSILTTVLDTQIRNDMQNKKRKFKLGEGTQTLLNHFIFQDQANQIKSDQAKQLQEKKPEKVTEEMKEPVQSKDTQEQSSSKKPAAKKEKKGKKQDDDEKQETCSSFKPLGFSFFDEDLQKLILELQESQNQERRKPKVPKGVKDTLPNSMKVKSKAIQMIKDIFQSHGALEIDTPVFEQKETLIGKYGEEGGKLIYDLEDQGGELLSLRYDLTVPFSRFLATNNIKKLKRFHIAKVYRRDQPMMNKGRFREFYQCDIDFAGTGDLMIADAEIVSIMCQIYETFNIPDYAIKLSHRVLLEAIIEESGASLDKFKTICSSVDKLDKEKWETVAQELIEEKGIRQDHVENLKKYVLFQGPLIELCTQLRTDKVFSPKNKKADIALAELELLGSYLKHFGFYDKVVFDTSMARGLDYYTGIIFEGITKGGKVNVGSIGGGGRYDNLMGAFSGTKIPSIGMSIGIERVFLLMEEQMIKNSEFRASETEVVVATIGKNLVDEKLKITGELWKAGIKAEHLFENNPKPSKQLEFALDNQVPIMLWIGEDEVKNGTVKAKVMYTKEEEEVPRDSLVSKVQDLVAKYKVDKKEGKVKFEQKK